MEPIKEGFYYHIYNRGAGKANLFWRIEDYREFIRKYYYYLYPSVQTYAWCLMRNHFHLLIRIREIKEQKVLYDNLKHLFERNQLHGKLDPAVKPFVASKQLSHLMNSYTRFINKKHNRSGTLIEGPLKRKRILDEENFLHLICYIHRNPIHHLVVKSYSDYKYSSYSDFVGEKKSFIEKEEVMRKFGGLKNFKVAHEEIKLNLGDDFYLE